MQKLIFGKVFLFASLIMLCTIGHAAHAESVQSNDITLEVLQSGEFKVREHVVWNFDEGAGKHGIIRQIPQSMVPGSAKRTNTTNFLVTDDRGEAYQFAESNSSDWRVYRIGDPNVTVSGPVAYAISYDVQDGLGYFKDFTEVYWNMIGTEWTVPIEQTSASVVFPPGVKPLTVKAHCGSFGSKEECATFNIEDPGNGNPVRVHFQIKKEFLPLAPGYGMTIAVTFPRGFIASEPTAAQIRYREIVRYLSYAFFASPVIVMYAFYRKRRARKKIWKRYLADHTVISQYDAAGCSPLQADIVHNERARYDAVAAEITFLIANGYLEAKEDKDGQTVFARLSRSDADLLPHQKFLLQEMSGKGELELKQAFEKTAQTVLEGAVDNLEYRKMFADKELKKLKRLTAGSALSVGGTVFLAFFFAINPGVFVFALAGWHIGYLWSASCVLIGICAFFFKNTYKFTYAEAGMETRWHLAGLYLYIDTAEREKIMADADPEVRLSIAEKLLPYAMIFGMEKKWIAHLTKMLETSGLSVDTDAFRSHQSIIHSFATQSMLVSSFTTSVVAAQRSVSSSRSFSSGSSSGSSGGGGGGGGGSSW